MFVRSHALPPAVVIVFSLVVAGTTRQCPGGPTGEVPEILYRVEDTDGSTVAHARELESARVELMRVTAEQHAVLADLAAGRTTLDRAADVVLAPIAAHPVRLASLRRSYSGATDRERAARKAATQVCLAVGPDRAAEVMPRLGAEFRALFPDAAPLRP